MKPGGGADSRVKCGKIVLYEASCLPVHLCVFRGHGQDAVFIVISSSMKGNLFKIKSEYSPAGDPKVKFDYKFATGREVLY